MIDDRLRPLTRRLAELLASDDGALILAQLQKLTLAASRKPVSHQPGNALRVGIWDAVPAEDGSVEFARSEDLATDWRYWADVERIPAKKGRRVVLVGESVARAYLFDPAITFARMLEAMIGVEVVDLARTDLTANDLPALFDALPAFEPDVVVLFAGNNWHSVVFELEELQLLADAVRKGGFALCRQRYLHELLAHRARATLERIAERASDAAIPLCVIVPPFNLADWRSEGAALVPVLPEGANARWIGLHEQARDADPVLRGQLGAAMIALDGGTSAASHELAAEAMLAMGHLTEARAHLEAARDAPCGLLASHSPRCPGVVQDVLRAAAAEYGFAIVDAPALFAADREIAGRDMFLDYCHLTVEGLRRVARATATAIAPSLQTRLSASDYAIDPADEAMGHILAAIHNAHYGQPTAIVRHHCDRALALSPIAAEVLLTLVDLQSRRAPPWLCASYDKVLATPAARRYLGGAELKRIGRLADFALTQAMTEALEAAGVSARNVLATILATEPDDGEIDLLSARHRATTFRERSGHSLGPERAYFRATAPISHFYFVMRCAGPVQCRLTCRMATQGTVTVALNDQYPIRIDVAETWSTHELLLDARAGLNVLEVRWPPPRPPSAQLLENAARRLERGVYPDAFVAFGEVHALTATAVKAQGD